MDKERSRTQTIKEEKYYTLPFKARYVKRMNILWII